MPPQRDEDKGKLTLVIDLDETLVHSSFAPIDSPDFGFTIERGQYSVTFNVVVRPGAPELIEELGKVYEIVIFTASNQEYADLVIDRIDPHGYVRHRLYKESCVMINDCTVKDLSLLNRKLQRIIILDNSPMSYFLQPYNSYPVGSWTDDKNDTELFQVTQELLKMKDTENVYSILVGESGRLRGTGR